MIFKKVNKSKILELSNDLRELQKYFLNKYGVDDIFSNSKIFEIITADNLGHTLIPGHSGSRDAKDKQGGEIEYKHFKESSSNHSWTFNDFSDTTIEKLKDTKAVLFTHINDLNGVYEFDWYYEVQGKVMAQYLANATLSIKNTRKMINISANQLETRLGIKRTIVTRLKSNGQYTQDLNRIYTAIKNMEKESGVANILTSNKIWELLTSIHLNHNVNSEQGGREGAHDAFDELGNQFEYKISKSKNWNFQDISENVLAKYEHLKYFILAIKDVDSVSIKTIYVVNINLLNRIKEKLEDKKNKKGTALRRLQISVTFKDIKPYLLKEISIL
jgi:hypothetical protein